MLPDREMCRRLLEQADCTQQVLDHVEAVEHLAVTLARQAITNGHELDLAVVRAGALLHDIGRGLDHGPDHVHLGVAFLEEQEVDGSVVDCVACHMGAGITPAQARAWGWPPRRYLPVSLEEQLVCHADNLTFGTSYGTLSDVMGKLERQGLASLKDRMRELHQAVARAVDQDPGQLARGLER